MQGVVPLLHRTILTGTTLVSILVVALEDGLFPAIHTVYGVAPSLNVVDQTGNDDGVLDSFGAETASGDFEVVTGLFFWSPNGCGGTATERTLIGS